MKEKGMDMIDKAIVFVASMVLMILIFINIIGMMLSFVQKMNFDQICRSELMGIDLAGGLTEDKEQEFCTSLERAGYRDILVEAPEEVQYGDWIILKVCAGIPKNRWSNLFKKEEAMFYFSYERKIVSRNIHNMAYQEGLG